MHRSLIILLLSIPLLSYGGKTDTIRIRSGCLDTIVPTVIVTPESGFDSLTPVVVLLHGYGGDFASWVRNSDRLPGLADTYHVVFIAPDGGNSWYFNTEASGAHLCGERFPAVELIHFIRDSLGLASSPQLTALCGNSMGGHGALRIAGLHPDIYGYVGALSAVADLSASRKADEIRQRFSPADSFPNDSLSVLSHIGRLRPFDRKLFIDCGSEDYLLPANARLHRELLDNGIGHVWMNRPGEHDWVYWDESIVYFMIFLDGCLKEQE